MNLQYANATKWANRSSTKIDLTVRFSEISEDLPFTADPNDTEAHGRDIYARAVAGEFGEVAPFDPVPPTTEQVSRSIKSQRNALLVASDWTQLPDVPESIKAEWATYRQALRDFPQQAGFPWYDSVVAETDYGFAIETANSPWPVPPT